MLNSGIGGVKRIPRRSRACLRRPEKAHGKLEFPGRRNRRWVVLWEKAVEEGVKGNLKGKVSEKTRSTKTLIMKVVFGVEWSSRYD